MRQFIDFLKFIKFIFKPQECLLCRATTFTILKYNKDNEEVGSLKNIAKNLCSIFEIVPEDVCEGMVDVNAPTIKYIIKENPNILSETFCGIFMQADDCGPDSTIFDISFELPTEQIPRKMNQEMDTPIRAPANYTILHITDIHLDPFYEAGGNAVCGRGACCRKNQGKPSNESSAAGKWGDYRDCDTPWEAVVDLVQQIKRQHKKIDIIYYTGDIVDHFSWEITKQGNTDSIKKVFKLFRDNFQNIPIFPVLGNHEAYPSNVFAPTTVTSPEVSIKWLYDLANEEWESWLPSTTKKTIQEGGYYTVLVNPGFRIVALNNNICYHSNWWILHDTLYFTEQLQWLHDVLMAASLDSEIVHILGHVPSNDPYCYKGWTKSYRAIVNKFQNVIASQFNGHSHVDEFNLYYSEDNTTPISTAWNGASATTFAYLNPNYRVYYADSETHEILDFETWIYNLTEANLTPDQNPRWFKEYSFKEEYGLKDLSPKSIDGLVKRFATDRELLFKVGILGTYFDC